jgi:uncharacterized membrane protein
MQADGAIQPAAADRVAQWLLRQWVWVIAGLLAIYAGLPWLSPLLRSLGFDRAGRLIFRLYSTLCHQLPERSFFLGGYQVCYCHRCTALYSSLLLLSVLYGLGRWRWTISRRALLLLTLPMAIDGVWHVLDDLLPTLGLRSADSSVGSLNFWLRMITGALFAAGVVLWGYPQLQRATQPLDSLSVR